MSDKVELKILTPAEIAQFLKDDGIIVDVRNAADFKESFIPSSYFIGLDGNFEDLILNLIPVEQPLAIVGPDGQVEKISGILRSLGYFAIKGYLECSAENVGAVTAHTDLIIDVEADELALDIPFDENLTVLDVRKAPLFAEGHVKGALSMPLMEMTDIAVVARLEETHNIYVHSQTGYQSVIALSILKRQGYHNVRNVNGGWISIQQEKSIKIEKDPTLLN